MPAKKTAPRKKVVTRSRVKKVKPIITFNTKTPAPEVESSLPNAPSMVTVPVDTETTQVTETASVPVHIAESEVETELSVEPSRGKFWIVLPIALVVGALVGGSVLYMVDRPQFETLTMTSSPTATPSVDPSPTVERKDLKVQVLNGTGVKGAAGVLKTNLEKLGYESVAIGNANSSDYDLTEISIKEAKKVYVSLLTSDLTKESSVSSEIKTLDEKNQYDAVITLGQE